jgi:hypothetical protein
MGIARLIAVKGCDVSATIQKNYRVVQSSRRKRNAFPELNYSRDMKLGRNKLMILERERKHIHRVSS